VAVLHTDDRGDREDQGSSRFFVLLFLGAVLYFYSTAKGIVIPTKTDNLFPIIALNHLGQFAGIIFVIGLISAAYPSADGALTSLTTSVCVDFLNFQKRTDEASKKKTRHAVHLSFAFLLLLVIVSFKSLNDSAIVEKLFKAAGYTYGPLLGLFMFGLFTKFSLKDKWSPYICILAPLICYILNEHSKQWFGGYEFGFLILPLNGIITFLGLYLIRSPRLQNS